MFRTSLDAIRSMLRTTFPNVDRIYISNVPTRFKRPSFFVQSVSDKSKHLNKKLYNANLTWQIVYFAPKNGSENPDVLDQFAVSDILKSTIMEKMELTAPDGTVFNVIECEGGPRDAEVYITIKLDVDMSRTDPELDKMQDINVDITMSDIEIKNT